MGIKNSSMRVKPSRDSTARLAEYEYEEFETPGDGGFDLHLTRAYSTHRAKLAFGGKSVVGHGWDLHMGRILFNGPLNIGVCNILKSNQFSTSNPVLELPDGSKKLFIKETRKRIFLKYF